MNCLCKNEPEMNPIVMGTKLMWECPRCGRAIARPNPMKMTVPVVKEGPLSPTVCASLMKNVNDKTYRIGYSEDGIAIRTATHIYTIDINEVINEIANIEEMLLRTTEIEAPNPKQKE